ncbi:MAG: hypothetical protein EBV10_10810 [Synechococcaceae bacterium WB6_1A_059]|nr:hypothetical protein [Synechococcaceae bacterium WB6_1A_059]
MINDVSKFFGVWELKSFTTQYENNDVVYPLGNDAIGLLIYNPNGYVNVTLQKKKFDHFKLPDRQLASNEEKITAFDTFYAYTGKWFLKDNLMHHKIIMSIIPNWINTIITREPVWINNNNLNLYAVWNVDGKKRTANLSWKKVE